MTNDSPEQIQACLNCKRAKCTNCFERVRKKTEISIGTKTYEDQLAFVEAYIQAETDAELGTLIGKSQSSACKYRASIGLPSPSRTTREVRERLVNEWKQKRK